MALRGGIFSAVGESQSSPVRGVQTPIYGTGKHVLTITVAIEQLARSGVDHGSTLLRCQRWYLAAIPARLQHAGRRRVGFIALAGVAAEFGVIMLLYLKLAWNARSAAGATSEADLLQAIRDGAALRVRPKAMTVAVIIAGLLPIMWAPAPAPK